MTRKHITILYNVVIIQLMEDGVITEPGQNVQLIVGEELKPEPELVQTQLQLMVVQIVLGRRLILRTVTYRSAQVQDATINLRICLQIK